MFSLLDKKIVAVNYGSHSMKGIGFRIENGTLKIMSSYYLETLEKEGLNMKLANKSYRPQEEFIKNLVYDYNITRYIQAFFSEQNTFALSVPSSYKVFIRNFLLPLHEIKQIQQIVPNILEEEIPIEDIEELESVLYPYFVEKTPTESKTKILTFSIFSKKLEQVAAPFMSSNKFIDLLTVESMGLYNFLMMMKGTNDNHFANSLIAQIEIGHTYTIINIVYDDALIYTRTITLGGKDITDSIAEICKVDLPIAEQIKKDMIVSVGSAMTLSFSKSKRVMKKKEKDEILSCLSHFYENISKEFYRSFKIASENRDLGGKSLDKVFISGGGSLLSGCSASLSKILGMPIESYNTDLTRKLFNSVTSSIPLEKWIISIGLAWTTGKSTPIDYTKTPFGQRLRGIYMNWKSFTFPLFCCIVAIFSIGLGIFFDIHSNRTQVKNIGQLILKEAQGMSELKSARSSSEVVSRLKKICKDRLSSVQKSSLSTMYMIQELDTQLSELGQENVIFRFFSYQKGKVKLDLEVESLEKSTELETKLASSSLFSEVNINDRNILPNKTIRLRIELLLDPKLTATKKDCL